MKTYFGHETAFNPYPNRNETCGYDCWWNDPALPKFNFENKEVEDFLLSVGKYWVEKGIDGWRLDVAEKVSLEFWNEFRKWVDEVNPNAYSTFSDSVGVVTQPFNGIAQTPVSIGALSAEGLQAAAISPDWLQA